MQDHTTPADAIVAEMVNGLLDPCQREDFEERAGIIEYDGKRPRGHAECLALLDLLHRNPAVLSGITVLQIELDGGTQWLLTADVPFARHYLCDVGGKEIGVVQLLEVINEQYGGIATLTTLG